MRTRRALVSAAALAASPQAYLGHMASETVISHNVMTSGQLPKNMGWADEWYRDAEGVLGDPGQQYVSGSMSRDRFDALITHGGYPKLSDYLERAHPGRVTATVGEKAYAVNSMSSPSTDIQVTFSSRNYDCDGDGELNWRGPVTDNSLNVPDYIAEPECGRFYIDSSSSKTYGTGTTSPAWMDPLDANRFVPGKDPQHKGGDVWVADAAMEIMERERWSGMFLTLGGIDKAGHMWGGQPDRPPYPEGATGKISHIQYAAKVADRQVGRLMNKLERLGQLDEKLVVLTTDHGQLWSQRFHGQNGPGRGNYNWYDGSDEDETYEDPQPAMQRLIDPGNMETSMQDSAIRTWLDDTSRQPLTHLDGRSGRSGARSSARTGATRRSWCGRGAATTGRSSAPCEFARSTRRRRGSASSRGDLRRRRLRSAGDGLTVDGVAVDLRRHDLLAQGLHQRDGHGDQHQQERRCHDDHQRL